MARRKRQASSTAHLINPDSEDTFTCSSPVANKRPKCQKSNNVGDGWLWRPSRPKIPSPKISPVPLHWQAQRPKVRVSLASSSGSDPFVIGCHSDKEDDKDISMTTSNNGHVDYTPGPSASSGRSLKSISKRLKALDDKIGAFQQSPATLHNELVSLKESVRALEERTQRNEIRAALRHDMIFDAIKKISQDVNQIKSSTSQKAAINLVAAMESEDASVPNHDQTTSSISPPLHLSGPPKPKVKRSPGPQIQKKNQEAAATARKTMERCLNQYMDKMNNATTADEVKKTGSLCKQYAEDLIKTYI